MRLRLKGTKYAVKSWHQLQNSQQIQYLHVLRIYQPTFVVDFGIFSVFYCVLNHVYVCVSLLSIAYCLLSKHNFGFSNSRSFLSQ